MTLALAVLLTVLDAAPKAPAPASSDAALVASKKAFKEGERLYGAGQWRPALAKFSEAYELKQLPLLIFNMARCHERLGETAKALRRYRDFARLSTSEAPQLPTVRASIAALERRLQEQGLQQLLIFSEPAQAVIEVDGQALGPTPTSVELSAGEHRIVARLEGYPDLVRIHSMATAHAAELDLTMEKTAPPPPPLLTLEPLAPAEPTPSVIASPAVRAEAPRAHLAPWILGGVAVASAGAGVGFGLAASANSNTLRDGTVRTQSDAQALHDRARGYSIGADAAYGVAGAAAITALVVFLIER